MALEKTVRVGSLPKGTQEALLQQAFEKIAPVARVSVHERTNEALVELTSEEVRLWLSPLTDLPFSIADSTLPLLLPRPSAESS